MLNPCRRVLVVAPQPFYEDRGTPIAVRHVLEALDELSYQVDLLTYPVGTPIEIPSLRIFRVGQKFRFSSIPIGFSPRKLFLNTMLIPALRKRLQQEQYCCIHAIEEAAFLAVLAARKYNLPVIYDMQSSLPEQLVKHWIFQGSVIQHICRLLERWLIRQADFVVCSTGLKEYVYAVSPTVEVREWFFPSATAPISPEKQKWMREQLGISPQERVVLYTGNAEPYQGLSTLFDAMPGVLAKVPNTVFVLVGVADLIDIRAMTKIRGIRGGEAVRVFGRQPQHTMPLYMAIADVLVTPREPVGNASLKIFDYMASGRPIVATDCPAHRTVLNAERALLTRPCAKAFAEAIICLLQDQEKAARLGAAARRYADEKLGWKAFVELIQHVYQGAQRAKFGMTQGGKTSY